MKVFSVRLMFGKLSQIIFLSYGGCGRCHMTWNICDYHITSYANTGGCFPLCTWCWNRLTIEERLPYYKSLVYDVWEDNKENDVKWSLIKKAVLEGK